METTVKIKDFNKLKVELKKKYSNLTDTDLTYSEGKEDEFIDQVGKKSGKTNEEVIHAIEEIQSNFPHSASNETPHSEGYRKEGQAEKSTPGTSSQAEQSPATTGMKERKPAGNGQPAEKTEKEKVSE